MGDKMSEIFAELDTTNHNYLDKNDVNEMLTERGIRHTQEDIDRLLMVFGTGQAISLTSLVATLKTMCGDTSSLLS